VCVCVCVSAAAAFKDAAVSLCAERQAERDLGQEEKRSKKQLHVFSNFVLLTHITEPEPDSKPARTALNSDEISRRKNIYKYLSEWVMTI